MTMRGWKPTISLIHPSIIVLKEFFYLMECLKWFRRIGSRLFKYLLWILLWRKRSVTQVLGPYIIYMYEVSQVSECHPTDAFYALPSNLSRTATLEDSVGMMVAGNKISGYAIATSDDTTARKSLWQSQRFSQRAESIHVTVLSTWVPAWLPVPVWRHDKRLPEFRLLRVWRRFVL